MDQRSRKIRIKLQLQPNSIIEIWIRGMLQMPEWNISVNDDSILGMLNRFSQQLLINVQMTNRLKERVESMAEMSQKIVKLVGTLNCSDSESALTRTSSNNMSEASQSQNQIQRLFIKNDRANYKYRLILRNDLTFPLYTRKNFSIMLGLYDLNDQLIISDDNIQLEIQVYTAGKEPELLDVNKNGQKVIKCNHSTFLNQGYAHFQKLAIREVSSKYQKGTFTLVIVPRKAVSQKNSTINEQDIMPLIIKNVHVKAKKT